LLFIFVEAHIGYSKAQKVSSHSTVTAVTDSKPAMPDNQIDTGQFSGGGVSSMRFEDSSKLAPLKPI
jgi:microsomal dipeptidase-like Zn-dependent dipeptidase